jgi:hypothetical protein
LLQDQQKGRRNDVARITANRVEDWLQQNIGRAQACQFRFDKASVRACASRDEIGRQGSDSRGDPARGRPEHEQVGGIRVDRDVGGDALEDVAFGIWRDIDSGKSLPTIDCGARLGNCAGTNSNA